jgi:hypothetical protein
MTTQSEHNAAALERAHQQHLDDLAGVNECEICTGSDVDEDAEYERRRDVRNEQE